jgi:hypothetical protein
MHGVAFLTSPSNTRARSRRRDAPADRQPHLRLRRLPAGLPLEQVRAAQSTLPDFDPREGLTGSTLVELFAWSEAEFLRRTEGSAIRRIGHERWQRNIAVAMGNALRIAHDPAIVGALRQLQEQGSALVREHTAWALAQQPVSPA